MKLGFIGIGIMGKPMVLNLLKKGFTVKAYDIREETRAAVVEKGAIEAFSPGQAAKDCEIVITMLTIPSIIEEVLFGEDGVIHSLKPGTLLIDCSSVSPIDSVRWAKQLEDMGIDFLDAPVSGGEPKAIEGTLSIMVGGKMQAFQRAKPVLQTIGSDITHVGKVGSGSTTKLANQILVNVTIAAMSEAVVLASKAGVDIEKMYQAIRGGLAGSTVLDAKIPLILERNFKPGGRIDINLKDLMNVLQTGRALGTPLPLTSNVVEMFQALKAHGKETDDHAGLIQYYEQLANYEVPNGGKR